MKMKNIFAVTALLLLAAGAKAQETPALPEFEGEFVFVRILEFKTMLSSPGIVVADGVNPPQTIRLKSFSFQNSPENLDLLAKVFNEVKRQGYKLSGQPASLQMDGTTLRTDYLFERESPRE